MASTRAPLLPLGLRLTPALQALKPLALARAMLRQPFAVWALFAYLFFEYVRPQSIYTAIDVLPFGQITLIAAVIGALATELRKRRWTLIDTGMTIYTLVLLASIVVGFDPAAGWDDIDTYLSWVLVYFAISTTVNTQARVVLMLAGWLLWNLKMSLYGTRSWASIGFAFRDWGVVGAPGWFENSGEFGIQMCVVFPIALYFALGVRPHVSKPVFLTLLVLPATCVIGAIASSSRGALLGMAVIGFWIFMRSRYRVRSAVALAILIVLGYVFTPPEQKRRVSSAGEDDTSLSRMTYWERGIGFANERPLLGIGYRSWISYYTYSWGNRLERGQRIQLPHNFFIEALAELGYTGLLSLCFLLFGSFWMNARTRALARRLGKEGRLAEQLGWGFDGGLIGFIVSGFFVTVLYYPYLWVNLGMTVALHLSVARTIKATRLAEAGAGPSSPSLQRNARAGLLSGAARAR